MLQRQMTSKLLNALMAVGISLCLLYSVYLLYIAGVRWAVAKIDATGAKVMVIAGFWAVTEGEVIYADETRVIIEYYYEWDGADYRKVLHHANANYPENTKVAVAYSVGMGIGSCLVVGLYEKHMLICGIMGLILFVSGIVLKLKRKGKVTWQEERL